MAYSVVHVDDIESPPVREYVIDGEAVLVRAGTILRFDPEATRVSVAGPDGMTMIAIGARRGSYEPRGPF